LIDIVQLDLQVTKRQKLTCNRRILVPLYVKDLIWQNKTQSYSYIRFPREAGVKFSDTNKKRKVILAFDFFVKPISSLTMQTKNNPA